MTKIPRFSKVMPRLTLVVLFSLVARSSALAFSTPESHPFGKAAVMDRVILSVIENYYDPARIDSVHMFKATMDTLQKAVAELKVTYDDEKNTCVIEVIDSSLDLDLKDLKSPWTLSRNLRKAFRFIESKLPKKEYDLMQIEYAAANAMLSALDPHSNALPPDIYESLQMDTAGEFGGLGIKITTDRRAPCKGDLTIVEVFDDTPASNAGLRVGDQITRIDDESTVNITTAEAANRLRGKPGTRVKVQVKRQNGALGNFSIERATIPIKSVEHEMLSDRVGYISLMAFQENSVAEMAEALAELHGKKMKGLVLDLRNNPGGLLHVAIAVADQFLPAGTIVTTAGRREEERSVENASSENTEPMYPMVVLINSSSASAAEIMAGALRNHGRALLIGETTFGKGSVQMVQPIEGGGAIKLTSAQYLTPGDISIQAVGVTPDVTFLPVSVDAEEIDLQPKPFRFSEADLDHHLDRPNVRTRTDRPGAETATLLIPRDELASDRARLRRCYVDEEKDDTYKDRFEAEFSRRLVAGADDGSTAEELLLRANNLIKQDEVVQERAIERALKHLNVDWSIPVKEQTTPSTADRSSSKVSASARLIGKTAPGSACKLKVTVTNGAKEPIYRLRAITESDNYLFDDLELPFGKLMPGSSRSWTKDIEIPVVSPGRIDDVKIRFESDLGPLPKESAIEVRILDRAQPRLVYNWQFQDMGNQDGVYQPGEELAMYIAVRNVGKGATEDAEVDLSAKPGIDLLQGRFDIGTLEPGASAYGTLKLRIMDSFPLREAKLDLSIREWFELQDGLPTTRDLLSREMLLPVSSEERTVNPVQGTVTVIGERPAILRESPAREGNAVASAEPGAIFETKGSADGFYRVSIGDNRQLWLSMKDVVLGQGGKTAPKITPIFIEPPRIQVKGSMVKRTNKETLLLKGTAVHPVGVRDVVVFCGEQKVLYHPAKPASKEIEFSVEVPLEGGANNILIVARHDDEVVGSESIFVRSDQPEQAK